VRDQGVIRRDGARGSRLATPARLAPEACERQRAEYDASEDARAVHDASPGHPARLTRPIARIGAADASDSCVRRAVPRSRCGSVRIGANSHAIDVLLTRVGSAVWPSLLGAFFAFLAGLLALKWLSRWLENGRWYLFGAYCGFAAMVIAILHHAGY